MTPDPCRHATTDGGTAGADKAMSFRSPSSEIRCPFLGYIYDAWLWVYCRSYTCNSEDDAINPGVGMW